MFNFSVSIKILQRIRIDDVCVCMCMYARLYVIYYGNQPSKDDGS